MTQEVHGRPVESARRTSIGEVELWRRYLLNKVSVIQDWPKQPSSFLDGQSSRAKRAVLDEWAIPDADWIETGTYFGQMTKWLAKRGKSVISLEPQEQICQFATNRLRRHTNIEIRNQDSSVGLEQALQAVGDRFCVFLDGHYSGDITFLGSSISPIEDEISILSKWVTRDVTCRIFIDDFRLFGQTDLGFRYPSPSLLVNFADSTMDGWTVANDIFVAWKG